MVMMTIAGCGIRSPLGFNRVSTAAAVRGKISVIAEHPFMIDQFGQPMKVTMDGEIDPGIDGAARLTKLAIPAAMEAISSVIGSNPRTKILLNFGQERPGLTPATCARAAQTIGNALGEHLNVLDIRHWMGGHAGTLIAMQSAVELLRAGDTDFVLVGGIESYLFYETMEWLDEIEQLHSDDNTFGFCPGEAAGFVLLAAPGRAQGLINVAGVGSGTEKNLIKTEDICLGDGLAAAFKAAAASAGLREPVDRIICDMNGERYRGNEYGFAVLKAKHVFEDAAAVQTPADCWGDIGAASGVLYTGLVIEAEARGYAPGPTTLIWAGSEAGTRAAVILSRQGAN